MTRPFCSLSMIFGIILCSAMWGCGGRQVSPFDHLNPQQARELARQLADQHDRELQADLQSAFAHHAPRNILLLSGGDAHGAFGCGILSGWRNAPGGRPAFDIVTGVSTGALMATFVFLGEEQDDLALRETYTHISDKDIMGSPFAPGPPDSVFDTAPLRRLIAKQVTPAAIKRVAAAHQQGRRLYVATVELDSGAVVIWPLSKIAADAVDDSTSKDGNSTKSNRIEGVSVAGIERFRQILLATASIPLIFPPVEIDGGLHVDAGLRETVFIRRAMLGVARAYASANSAPEQASPPPAIYAIFNGKLHSEPQAVDDNLFAIGVRSLTLYTQSLQIFNLRDAAHLAAAHDPPFKFNWIAEPEELDSPDMMNLTKPMFDPTVMTRLFNEGQSLATQPNGFWHAGPPTLDGDP